MSIRVAKRRYRFEEEVSPSPRQTRRSEKFKDERQYPPIEALTQTQKVYLRELTRSDQLIVLGPAGTGKTYIAGTHAADLLRTRKVDKIIISRPNVSSGQKLGYNPGTQDEKLAPWVRPIVRTLTNRMGPGAYESAVRNGNIEVIPFETMRGDTFEKAFIILDEAQNTTPHEMKMFMTRFGKGSQLVVNGDIEQHDLKETSGLKVAIDLARKHITDVPVIEFTLDDIVRSDRCAQWARAFHMEKIH